MEQIENAAEARLEDRFQIEQTIRRWARAVDRRDWALVREVFHSDAIDDHGMYKGSIDGLIEGLEVRHQCITMSMHVLGNIFIEFPIICKQIEYKKYIFLKSLSQYIDIKNFYYTNCDSEKTFLKYKKSSCLNAKYISENIIMIPVNIGQKKKDLDKIIDIIK